MAILTLTSADAGKTIPVSGSLDWEIVGTDAAETIEVAAGTVATVKAGGGKDVIKLLGGAADYSVALEGSNAVFTHTVTGKKVFVPMTTAGDSVAFGNGAAVDLKIDAGAFKLGTQTLTTTSAAVTGATGTATGGSTGGSTAGQSFSLTTAATDAPVMTAGNDTVTGGTNALNTGDLIVDQQTTDNDVLNAVITADNNSAAPTIRKIENVALDFKGFGLKFDALNTQNSLITVSTTQAGNSAAQVDNLGANGVNVAVGTGISTLTLGGTAGTTDATTVTLKGGNLTLESGTKIETLTLNSAGAANVVTDNIAVANAGKVQISGTQNLTLKVDPDNITGIEVVKATGYTGVATLEIAGNGASAGIDLAKAAVDSILISVDPGSQDVTVAKGATVHLAKADTYNNTAKGLKLDASGTLNLVIDAAAATVANANIFIGANAATVNLTNSAATTITALDLTADTTTLNALGSTALTLTDVKADDNAILNFSGHTGVIELTGITNTNGVQVIGNDAGSKLTAGAGADTIVGGTGADTIGTGNGGTAAADQLTGGAGADTFVIGSADSTATTTVVVTDFVKGTDKLVLTGATTTDAVDLTKVAATITNGMYIFGKADGSEIQIQLKNADSALTATDLSDSVQLGSSATAFAAAKSVKAGKFDDNIDLRTSAAAATVTGGLGADKIEIDSDKSETLVVAAGDSTIAAYDSITGFDCAGGDADDDILDLPSATIISDGALTNTFAGATVTAASGLVTGQTLTVSNFNAFLTYLGTEIADGDTVGFAFGGNTYVFQGNATADIFVELVGVTGVTDLAAAAAANNIVIA